MQHWPNLTGWLICCCLHLPFMLMNIAEVYVTFTTTDLYSYSHFSRSTPLPEAISVPTKMQLRMWCSGKCCVKRFNAYPFARHPHWQQNICTPIMILKVALERSDNNWVYLGAYQRRNILLNYSEYLVNGGEENSINKFRSQVLHCRRPSLTKWLSGDAGGCCGAGGTSRGDSGGSSPRLLRSRTPAAKLRSPGSPAAGEKGNTTANKQ